MSYFTDKFDKRVVELLKNGAVGFMPTDTIYGLSALALNEAAVEKIHDLKKRDQAKPLIVLIANIAQADNLGLNPDELKPVKDLWPAPLTLICRSTENTPDFLHRGTYTLAVRVPDNDKLRGLLSKTGPLVSTSANLQDQQAFKKVEEAKQFFGQQIEFYVDWGTLSGRPSTIARLKNGQIAVLRQGAYVVR